MASTRLGWGSALVVPFFLAGVAASHAASAGPGRWAAGSVTVDHPAAQATAAAAAPTPLPAVGAGQVLAVTIEGAGLTAGPSTETVTLHRDGRSSRFTAAFGPLSVVDARWTLTGWTLRVSVLGPIPPGTATVHPARPVTVSGIPSEVRSLGSSRLGGAPVGIMAATPGGGGGTFSDGGTIDLESSSVSGDSVTVQLAVSVS